MLMSWYMSGYHTGYYQVRFLCCDVYSWYLLVLNKKKIEIVYVEIAYCSN
ncbi:unnamed protein product [Angiostrongylus costaricensis]|uniref:SMN domain-containing protein n=1 Tax=Angiostrongylus costaricensis TaxID=334426 RepID=A0A0R3P9M8_ANGCS|nr:unnamed protein product [Angiostrongylus costaricensis]